MVVTQIASDIEEVAYTAEAQGQPQPKAIGEGASEETDDTEGGIDGNIRVICYILVELTSTTKTVHCIEHAGAEEANEGDK